MLSSISFPNNLYLGELFLKLHTIGAKGNRGNQGYVEIFNFVINYMVLKEHQDMLEKTE